MEPYKVYKNILSPEEVKRINQILDANEQAYTKIRKRFGFNLSMNVFAGDEVKKRMPEVFEMASTKIHKMMEEHLGRKIKFLEDEKRACRVHRYQHKGDGLMWHIDGADYTALIHLKNSNEGGTEFVSAGWSKILIPFFYLFPFSYLLNRFDWLLYPFRPFYNTWDVGDASFITGRVHAHRAKINKFGKDRRVLAVSFVDMEKKKMNLWDYLSKKLIYEEN